MRGYDHSKIEKKWQKEWAKKKLYKTADKVKGKDNFYLLVEFPYPSGNLHVGHWYAFAVPDIYARHLRMQGKNVMYPIGFDAFGLPAENAAIKNKLNPRKWTEKNIAYMTKQIESMGTSFDWSRKVSTIDPNYYRWTQWLFLQFFKKGLAYKKETVVNWCPKDKTVLANEQVVSGRCERCDSEVEQRKMLQWNLKITDYADRLIDDLTDLDWPEQIKESQKNWIGRSEGAEIDFFLDFGNEAVNAGTDSAGKKAHIKVFTTRADTLFGATYLVLSPEHPWVQLAIDRNHAGVLKNQDAVRKYVATAGKKSELERQENKQKTGVPLEGVFAINPATNEKIPMYVADYVLAHYGTGAIMAVPAHDERDFEFAKKFDLPITFVVAPETGTKRENEERRDGGCAVVFDPKTQKYAVAKNPSGIYGLFAGGIDGTESFRDGILREVREESGLHDFKHVEEIGATFSHFHNPRKNVNRVCLAKCMLVILESTDQQATQLEAHEDFTLHWTDADDILDNWKRLDTEKNRDHWDVFVRQAVSRAIELGYDTTSDANKYRHAPYIGEGKLVNSGAFDELPTLEASAAITKKYGTKKTTYKMRDWVVSRQRFWGVPIPIIHCEKCGDVAVADKDLPVKLPDVKDYLPAGDGKSPLAKVKKFVNAKCPQCKGKAERETDTFDTFVDSSWYFQRYSDPTNKKKFADAKKLREWMPVDLYSGGAEHTTMHVLYSRFWHKAMYDLGLVNESEPYTRRMNRSLIMGPDGQKMSKSRGNVIDPDEVVKKLGADTVRMYLAFIGPYSEVASYPWNPDGVVGVRRFLERVWRLQDRLVKQENSDVERALHIAIKKVTEDMPQLKFNTAIAALMSFLNEADSKGLTKKQYSIVLQLLAPFAPHTAEELWRAIGNKKSIHLEKWPKYDEKKTVTESITYAVQVNGKLRAQIVVPTGSTEQFVSSEARNSVEKWLVGATLRKSIFVPNRLVNFVIDQGTNSA